MQHLSFLDPFLAFSVWPFLFCMSALFFLADTPLFAAADTPPSPQPRRVKTLDGLRGFLALSVCLNHAVVYWDYLRTGSWLKPESRFYEALGPAGVGLFFMITGYLFWSRLLRDKGRADWLRFYLGRIFRIGPLFLFAFVSLVLYLFTVNHFATNVSAPELLRQLRTGLFLGWAYLPEMLGHSYTYVATVLDGVTWTLHWEWLFYVLLLFIGWITRYQRLALAAVVGLLVLGQLVPAIAPPQSGLYHAADHFARTAPHALAWLIHKVEQKEPFLGMFSMFLYGMLTAALQKFDIYPRLPDAANSVAAIAALILATCVGNTEGPAFHLLLGIAFYLIASGCTLFGLLTTRPARRLGDISYGIYLLQGLPHAIIFRNLRAFDLTSVWVHWGLTLFASVVLIGLATLTHVYIERPGIDAGKRVGDALRERLNRWSGRPALTPAGSARNKPVRSNAAEIS